MILSYGYTDFRAHATGSLFPALPLPTTRPRPHLARLRRAWLLHLHRNFLHGVLSAVPKVLSIPSATWASQIHIMPPPDQDYLTLDSEPHSTTPPPPPPPSILNSRNPQLVNKAKNTRKDTSPSIRFQPGSAVKLQAQRPGPQLEMFGMHLKPKNQNGTMYAATNQGIVTAHPEPRDTPPCAKTEENSS